MNVPKVLRYVRGVGSYFTVGVPTPLLPRATRGQTTCWPYDECLVERLREAGFVPLSRRAPALAGA